MSTNTSTLTKTQLAGARRSKQYKALIAIGLDADTAMKTYQREVKGVEMVEPEPETPDPIALLVAAGFTEDEARRVLATEAVEAAAKATPAPVAQSKPETTKDVAEALVEQHGLTFTKGRVYITTDMIEAAVRVRKTGSPEIVTGAGVGRTAAVLLFKGEAGTVALQNLTQAKD